MKFVIFWKLFWRSPKWHQAHLCSFNSSGAISTCSRVTLPHVRPTVWFFSTATKENLITSKLNKISLIRKKSLKDLQLLFFKVQSHNSALNSKAEWEPAKSERHFIWPRFFCPIYSAIVLWKKIFKIHHQLMRPDPLLNHYPYGKSIFQFDFINILIA